MKDNPKFEVTEDQIQSAKYPAQKCQFCGQLGCDGKVESFYVHLTCLDFVNTETRKFIVQVLHLPVKKK